MRQSYYIDRDATGFTCCTLYIVIHILDTKDEMELLEGQFLLNEWTPAFLAGRTVLGSCNAQEPSSKKQKTARKEKKNRQKSAEEPPSKKQKTA